LNAKPDRRAIVLSIALSRKKNRNTRRAGLALLPVRLLVLLLVLLFGPARIVTAAQANPDSAPPAQPPSAQQMRTLADQQRWQEIVPLLEPLPHRTAEMDFYLGIALAQLGRLPQAEEILLVGRHLAPADSRFPVELAGIAFKQKNYPQAARRLRQALRLAPGDPYANNFLATVYFLEDNLPAALKYWNRAGKPEIAQVRSDPQPRVAPALLDRAFAFSPSAPLELPQFLLTDARVRSLGIFPQYQFDLDAQPGGSFDLVFRAREQNGFGDGKLEALFLFFQGLPFQEVTPQYFNLHREAINFDSMYRWDAQKRRVFARFSGPFERSAEYRWQLSTDLRDENWALRSSFTGPAPTLASFNLRHETADFTLSSIPGASFTWMAGAGLSHRNFRSVVPGQLLTPQMLAEGYQLKQQAQVSGVLWRIPEHRFTLSADAASDAARLWSRQPQSFEKLTGSLGWHWFPQSRGDDFETSQQLRAGRTFGQPPFDELFILGLERDNDLPLHAHIGTRDGRKGSAPLGRNYLLENWQLDKSLYGNGLLKLALGPLFDIGKITDPNTQLGAALGSQQWLFDTGAQAKVRVLGSGFVFSWGRDLRTGNNAWYVTLLE
jgi:tetratricopeptide (TPR) repeat protein